MDEKLLRKVAKAGKQKETPTHLYDTQAYQIIDKKGPFVTLLKLGGEIRQCTDGKHMVQIMDGKTTAIFKNNEVLFKVKG